MWGREVDVCGYFGGRGGGYPPPRNFLAKIANFECFINISRLNDHKNFGGGYPDPQGATSPLKFFLAIGFGVTILTWSTNFGAGLGIFWLDFAFSISGLPYKHPLIITGAP